jgi:glyoxylase I family protein
MLIRGTINFGIYDVKEKAMAEMARKVTGFHHAALRARDFDASVRFYTRGLGLSPKIAWGEGDGRAVMLDAGNGNALEIFADGSQADGGKGGGEPEGALLHLAFRTGDCDMALEAARAAGAVVTQEPKTVTIPAAKPAVVRIAFCKGPDGELIELFQSDDV